MYKKAIVRTPSRSFPSCVSSHPQRSTVRVDKAREQHKEYCDVLKELGLEVITLQECADLPDSCFVEDTAVIRGDKALVTRLAMESRQGEESEVQSLLAEHLMVKSTVAPATLEGGDIIHTPDKLICGITQRTDEHGVKQLSDWLDVQTDTIHDSAMIHLKSHVTYLGEMMAVCTEQMLDYAALEDFALLVLPGEEAYAANTLAIGEAVLIPEGFPTAREIIVEAGFDVIAVDISEFEKCEGALTCLSLLF